MSLLLDDKLVAEVADVCPAEFLKYYGCLSGGDAQKCLAEQKTLSACVTSRGPSFKKIIKNCKRQMDSYEGCIRENPEYRTQCFDHLLEMRRCVAEVVEPK